MRSAAQPSVARGASIPAPVSGLNTAKAFSELERDEAAILDNFFPELGRVSLRRGSELFAYSLQPIVTEAMAPLATEGGEILGTEGNEIEIRTLMPYSAGVQKLFAATPAAIYEANFGQFATPVISSLSNGDWSYTMFATAGGNFLFIVNGANAARHYNGSTWSTPSITISGFTSADFIQVNSHKRRLWFVIRDSLLAAYLPVDSISGSATLFDLAPVFPRGGQLIAMGTLTRDGGDGLDDLAVWITSEGEIAIYQGTDPDEADAWSLVGVFRVGRPLGRRCLQKLGPELLLLTEDGFGELSNMITRSQTEPARLSRVIHPSIVEDARSLFADFGWQFCFYPKGSKLFVNVPRGKQYVMNTETLAWCTFSGWDASCMEVFEGDLFFAGKGAVYKADIGESDAGLPIVGDVLTAAQYFGSRGRLKRFTMVRPIIEAWGEPMPTVALNADFREAPLGAVALTEAPPGAKWDLSKWDITPWSPRKRTTAEWQSVEGVGYSAALRMQIRTMTSQIGWIATDYLFEPGGYV